MSVAAAMAFVTVASAAPASAADPTPRGDSSSSTVKAAKAKVKTVKVKNKKNKAAHIVPFTDAIYPSCAGIPDCISVGRVAYNYRISQYEVTVGEWVRFLNVVNPDGKNRHKLWNGRVESSAAWPKPGSVDGVVDRSAR